jgi:hypothetical protein
MKVLKNDYECKKNWPEDCYVQGDTSGIVFCGKGDTRETAFFEAFPVAPNDTFIRGEGDTLEAAEVEAFEVLEKYLACPDHEFKRKDELGAGICQHCSIQISDALPSTKKCEICKCDDASLIGDEKQDFCAACYYTVDVMGLYYAAQSGDIEPSEKETMEEFWTRIAISMLGSRAYVALMEKGQIDGLNTRQIRKKVNGISRYGHRTHSLIQDVSINYLLNHGGGEEFAVFFTQTKASQLLAEPSLNDSIAEYHNNILALMASEGKPYEEVVKSFSNELNCIVESFVYKVVDEGNSFYRMQTKPKGLIRARSSQEKDEGLKAGLTAVLNALSK